MNKAQYFKLLCARQSIAWLNYLDKCSRFFTFTLNGGETLLSSLVISLKKFDHSAVYSHFVIWSQFFGTIIVNAAYLNDVLLYCMLACNMLLKYRILKRNSACISDVLTMSET